MKDLIDRLNALLQDEDLTDDKLREASEGLLPNLADYLNAAEFNTAGEVVIRNRVGKVKPRMLQVFDEMNLHDTENNTRFLGICDQITEMRTSKAGDLVTIGTPPGTINAIGTGKRVAVLVIVEEEEYFKRMGIYKNADPETII